MAERRSSQDTAGEVEETTLDPPTRHARPKTSLVQRMFINGKALYLPLLAFYVLLIFSILYSLFVYKVLLVGDPVIGFITFDFATTNLLLSIASQLYASLVGYVSLALLDAMRWSLVSRSRGARGKSAATFSLLSPANDWFSVAKATLVLWNRNLYGLFRLAIPFMVLSFGSILKVQNSSEDSFIHDGPVANVFAGTIPLDPAAVGVVPTVYVTGFFDTWDQSLLNYRRFVTSWPLDDCRDNCKSYILPGSLEQVRRATEWLNETIFQGGIFDKSGAIRVNSAPAIVLRFDPIPAEVDFDLAADCTIYAQQRNDGFQFCRKQVGDAIAVGWRACPGIDLILGICNTETSWSKSPLRTKTLMTAYEQIVTTTYDGQDLSITQVQADTKPSVLHINLPDHETVWNRLFVPSNLSNADDSASVTTFLYRLPWLHRTYTEFYPDNNVIHLEILRNFLAINMQFAVSAVEYANYKDIRAGVKHELPASMRTTVSGGRSIERFVAQPWAAKTFIAAGCVITWVLMAGFVWVLIQDHPVPKGTGFTEWDMINRTTSGWPDEGRDSDSSSETRSFAALMGEMTKEERASIRKVVRVLRRNKLVFALSADDAEKGHHGGVLGVLRPARAAVRAEPPTTPPDPGFCSRATTFGRGEAERDLQIKVASLTEALEIAKLGPPESDASHQAPASAPGRDCTGASKDQQ